MKPCNGCGKCCLNYGNGRLGSASYEDVDRLILADRPDVIAWIDPNLGDLWVSPTTGEEAVRCPWLRKLPGKNAYKCRIHYVRPDVCREYPISIRQMVKDACEMLEPGDLDKPRKQLFQELKALRGGWRK